MPSTDKSLGSFRSPLADPNRRRPPRPEVPKEDRIGVIFVHGIGSQKAGETLLQWTAPIIEVLTEWRRWKPGDEPGEDRTGRTFPNATPHDPADPVIEAAIDLQTPLPTITLRIPKTTFPDRTEPYPESEWVMTEAWWASKVSPPGLSTMTSWLGPGGAAGRIVEAILANAARNNVLFKIAQAFLVPFVAVLAAVVLTLYASVRGVIGLIPIQAVKDAAILRAFDEFLIGWFGDARILLYDPAQSANIRAGLADAVLRLRETCAHVVVMAHSGGVMVSYLTLTDPAIKQGVQVDKLITFGEGWNLALELTADSDGMWDRIRASLMEAQADLRWRDFWASNDPAPAGRLRLKESLPPMEPNVRIRSTEVWNRRSIIADHGGYFDNDEEFNIRAIQEIDVPDGWGEASRFYRPDPMPSPVPGLPDEPRERRHRQRVALLALWRHMVVVLGVTTVALSLRFTPDRLVDIGTTIKRWVPPEVPIVPAVIDALKTFSTTWLDTANLDLPGLPPAPDRFVADIAQTVGLGVLQAVVPISALYLAAAVPQAYLAWPRSSPIRRLAYAIELGGIVVMLVSVVLVFLPGHDRLLGTGNAWLPGVFITIGTFAIAIVGTWVAKKFRVPLISNIYAAGSSVLFVGALLCSLIAIFRLPEVATSELAYVAIWVGAFVVLGLGRARWSGWDRVERRIARGPQGDLHVERRPVVATSFGVFSIAVCLMLVVLVGPTAPVEWIGVVGFGAILIGMATGAFAWREHGNPVASPGPVETGGA